MNFPNTKTPAVLDSLANNAYITVRMRCAFTLLLTCALSLAGCKSSSLEPIEAPNAQKPPGASGNPVLWIEPEARHPQGASKAEDDLAIASISENSGDTAEAIITLRSQLDKGSPRVRSAIVDALQLASHPDALVALVAASADRHPAVRALALDAINELSLNTRDGLLELAIKSDDALAAFGAALNWRNLVDRPDSSPTTGRVARAISQCSHPAAQMVMVPCERLETRPIAGILTGQPLLLAAREACLLELGEPKSVATTPELLAALQNDNSWVRYVAAISLARGHDALTQSAKDKSLAVLKRTAQTIDTKVAIAVAWAQAALGESEGIATLAVYLRAGEGAVRIEALDALAALTLKGQRLQRPDLYPALDKAASDHDTEIRKRVATVAGALDDGRVLPLLSRLVVDRTPQVRAATALAFAHTGQLTASAPHLIDLVTSDLDRDVLDSAFMALEHLVHKHPIVPMAQVGRFLSATKDGLRPFFGRDALRWRRWYQTEGR
jgi:HEAT repeat protein